MYVNIDAGRQLVNDWSDQDQRDINNKRNAVLDAQNAEIHNRRKQLWARDDQQFDDFQSTRKSLADQLSQGFGLGPDVSQGFSSQTPLGAKPAQPLTSEDEPAPQPGSAEDFRRQAETGGALASDQASAEQQQDQASVPGPGYTDANGASSAGGGRGSANPAAVSAPPSSGIPSAVTPSAQAVAPAQKPSARTITPGSAEDFEAQANAAARAPDSVSSIPGSVPKPSGTVPIMPNGQSYAAQAMANLAARARTAKSPDELNEIRQEALKLKIGQDAATIYDHVLKASPEEMAEMAKSVSDSPVNSYSMKFNPATNMTELTKDGHTAQYTRTDLAKILAARYRLQAGDASGLADIAAVDAGLAARVKEDLGMQEGAAKINTQTAAERDRAEYYRGQNAARMASANSKGANATSKEWYELSRPSPDLISIPDPTNPKGVSQSGALHTVWSEEYNGGKQSGSMDPYQAAARADAVAMGVKEKAKQLYDSTLAADKKSTMTMEDAVQKVSSDLRAARLAAAKQQPKQQPSTPQGGYANEGQMRTTVSGNMGADPQAALREIGRILTQDMSKAKNPADIASLKEQVENLSTQYAKITGKRPTDEDIDSAMSGKTQQPEVKQASPVSPADRIKAAGQGLPKPATASEAQFANVAAKSGWEFYTDQYGFPAQAAYRKKDANGNWVTKTGSDLAKELGVLY